MWQMFYADKDEKKVENGHFGPWIENQYPWTENQYPRTRPNKVLLFVKNWVIFLNEVVQWLG